MSAEQAIRKAGLKARDEILERLSEGGTVDNDLADYLERIIDACVEASSEDVKARPLSEYHEDCGFVTWWKFPVNEPSWIGSPNCDDWPGYHTHWTPHPPIPKQSS